MKRQQHFASLDLISILMCITPYWKIAFRTDEKDKPERSFKSNKWAIIAGVLAILLLTMMPLFAIYTLNQSKKTNIDQVKAAEGGGIVNPDEASIEPNMSMTYRTI